MRSGIILTAIILCAISHAGSSARQPKERPGTSKPAPPAQELLTGTPEGSLQRGVLERFTELYKLGMDEKLYIQTDKPYYSAGDTIWFKGYLANAVSGIPETGSNYIYVELWNRADSLITRAKVKSDDSGFHNALRIDTQIPPGEYVLRGYTRWMQNGPAELFFNRPVTIVNPLNSRFFTDISYRQDGGGRFFADVVMRDGATPLSSANVKLTIETNGKRSSARVRTDADGKVSVPFIPSAGESTLTIDANTAETTTRAATVRIPDFTTGYDVQFMPEGGALLEGIKQRVAFKAIGINGLSTGIKGGVYDSQGNRVAEIQTSHDGMGSFEITALADERYYAKVVSDAGIEKRFGLPDAHDSGYALAVQRSGSRMAVRAFAAPQTPEGETAIVIHSRGRLLIVDDYRPGTVKMLSMDNLPAGIAHIVLIDKKTLAPLSQRLVFIPGGRAAAAVAPGKPVYDARERAEVRFTLTGTDGKPVTAGQFAVSVTDRDAVARDSLGEAIDNYMLLTSDIKGHIENPGRYFTGAPGSAAARLDLLMLTQGWSRFDVAEVLAGRLAEYKVPHEESQSISGRVTGFFGNDAKRASLSLFSPNLKLIDSSPLDGKSDFRITGLDFPDSTSFVVQAMFKGKPSRAVSLWMTPDSFPQPSFRLHPIRPGAMQRDNVKTLASFAEQARKYYYHKTGVNQFTFSDVIVKAKKTVKLEFWGEEITFEPDRTITGADLKAKEESYGLSMPLRDMLIEMYPSTGAAPKVFSVTFINTPFDNYNETINFLEGRIYLDEVKSVDILRDAQAGIPSTTLMVLPDLGREPLYDTYSLGASLLPAYDDSKMAEVIFVVITFKDGRSSRTPLPSIEIVEPLGFKKPEHFYQPRYDVAEVKGGDMPDVRTTLLWDPTLKPDKDGNVSVWFYTADLPSSYEIVLEGITARGEPCRAVGYIQNRKP